MNISLIFSPIRNILKNFHTAEEDSGMTYSSESKADYETDDEDNANESGTEESGKE